MKLMTTIAALLIGTVASAQTDLSDRNNGLTHQIQCFGPPKVSGALDGLYAANLGFFVSARDADRAVTNRDLFIVPDHYDLKDINDVRAYLLSVGLWNFEPVIRSAGTKRSTVVGTEEVTETSVTPRGVALGPIPAGDNLTSMGIAVSDGQRVMRIRSSVDQEVHLDRAGGGSQTFNVSAGDTFVTIPSSGTYIARFQTTGTNNTKATGDQPFGDVTTTTTEVEVETRVSTPATGPLAWCYGRRAAN